MLLQTTLTLYIAEETELKNHQQILLTNTISSINASSIQYKSSGFMPKHLFNLTII